MPKYMPKADSSKSDVMEVFKSKEGSVGLSYPMLTKSNYTAWAIKMKVNMQAHGIWGAIEPADPNVRVKDKMDKVAMTAIFQAIPEDILLTLAEKKTAKDIWEAIKTLC